MTRTTHFAMALALLAGCAGAAAAQVAKLPAPVQRLQGDKGPPGDKGPQGDRGLPGPQGPAGTKVTLGYRVVPTPFTAAASSNNVYRSLCAANEKVVGGGYMWSSKGDGVMASRPMQMGQGWELVLFNFNPSALGGQVYAICMSGF